MKIRIGSFNVRNMGEASKKDYDRLFGMIDSERMDIVSLQEVLGNEDVLKYNVTNLLPRWNVYFDKPSFSKDSDKKHDRRDEGYAFIWNADKFEFSERLSLTGRKDFVPRIVGERKDGLHASDAKQMIRPPLYGRFKPVNGANFEIRLINLHLFFGSDKIDDIIRRQAEYKILLDTIYPEVSKKIFGINRPSYTIAMGDYNLNLYKFRGEAEKRINKHTYIPAKYPGEQRITTVQDELTTLKIPKEGDEESRGYSQNYDHFTYSLKEMEDNGIKCKYRRIDAVRKYYKDDFEEYRHEISDHVPIVMELSLGEEDTRI